MNDKQENSMIYGERKKLSDLKEGSFFVFTNRKKMPCIYNGLTEWNGKPVWLWSELKENGCWTLMGKIFWVIDYGEELPEELYEKRMKYLNRF
jgi:hypothetical protein